MSTLFLYLAVPSSLWHLRSLTRDQRGHSNGSTKSSARDHEEGPNVLLRNWRENKKTFMPPPGPTGRPGRGRVPGPCCHCPRPPRGPRPPPVSQPGARGLAPHTAPGGGGRATGVSRQQPPPKERQPTAGLTSGQATDRVLKRTRARRTQSRPHALAFPTRASVLSSPTRRAPGT